MNLAHLQGAQKIKTYDSGWELELDLVDTAIDVAQATRLEIEYTKPDGKTVGTWVAQPHASEKTVIVRVIQPDDFDVVGTWILRARYINVNQNVRLTGDPVTVRVIPG